MNLQLRINLFFRSPNIPCFSESFFKRLSPFQRPPRVRERLTTYADQEDPRETDLWMLTEKSIEIVRMALRDDPFEINFSEDGWFEDLTVYRSEKFMLGFISHENQVTLELKAEEFRILEKKLFPQIFCP